MNAAQTSTSRAPKSSDLDPCEYLQRFTAQTITSHEPHIQSLLNHLAHYGADTACTFHDPIHGIRELPEWMLGIINTPPLLRLAHVGQMTLMPHSRLAHSIGVAILAMDLATTHELGEEKKRTLVSLALLHDVRHGPYSHLFDNLYIEDKQNWFDHDRRLHEFLSQPDLSSALQSAGVDPRAIVDALQDPKGDANGYIVKGILDRVDYAMRDADNATNFFNEADKQRIFDAALNLYGRIAYDRQSDSFFFDDSSDTSSAISVFVGVRQYAYDRLAYDEDRRLAESLIYSLIKAELVAIQDTGTAGDRVIELSHLSDQELEASLPQAARRVLDSAKSGQGLGFTRIDGGTLTSTFKALRGRTHGGPGATTTILEALKPLEPDATFLVAIVPQISPQMHFRIRTGDSFTFTDGRASNTPGGLYDQTKCIAISGYGRDGSLISNNPALARKVQEIFAERNWSNPPLFERALDGLTLLPDDCSEEAQRRLHEVRISPTESTTSGNR